ncbi:preprotein translocase subunit YajC [Sphingomonas jejuensis]|uniref:Sec translocon accessory complex subunit YajC n=1 Tax=Sphingomonas jejuensis TaxID=904715 RepID=A0ABX0XNX0_9SPHN|nr:preprotein translocase subunit YajC [Sphingomonas jejuensis]NJC34479.1 preprotein translocase subunit YajC [Sphingomonas jejuensis]
MLISPAFAQTAGTAAPGAGAFIAQLAPLVLIFVIFYVLLIRPQQKRVKEHRAKVEAVRKNDQVVTGGGLIGKVTRVEADHVEVEVAPNVRVRAVKGTLSDVMPAGGTKPAND